MEAFARLSTSGVHVRNDESGRHQWSHCGDSSSGCMEVSDPKREIDQPGAPRQFRRACSQVKTMTLASWMSPVSAEERLAFGGAPGLVGPVQATIVASADDTDNYDAAADVRDRVAYRALLAFTLVLFVRPQDTFPLLDPLHLAEVFGTFGILALAVVV